MVCMLNKFKEVTCFSVQRVEKGCDSHDKRKKVLSYKDYDGECI